MKKFYLIFALLSLISLTITAQPQLTWRFNNVEVINAGTQLQFDVEVKASAGGSYHRDVQIYFDYNTLGFGSSIVTNSKITWTPLTLMNAAKYSVVNMADNTISKFAIITEAINEMTQPGSATTYFEQITTSYQGFIRFTVNIAPGGNTQTAGIAFDQVLMNGGQYHQGEWFDPDGAGPLPPYILTPKYTDPCLYENNLSTFKLSSLYGLLTYRNTLSTVINDCSVSLYQGAVLIDVAPTGVSGNTYYFSGMADGAYTLKATSNKAWNINSIAANDALLISRYVLGSISLTNLQKRAGDVNWNNDCANNDGLLIKRRVLGNITAWQAPNYNWVFDGPFGVPNGVLDGLPVTVVNGLMLQSFQGLLTGDVNGSYTPPPVN